MKGAVNMMNIKNETIKKLTNEELQTFGVFSAHIISVKGKPKTRVKGLKTTLRTETEIHYEGEKVRYEVIRTADEYQRQYVVRLYDKENEKYDWLSPLIAVQFMNYAE